MQRRAHWHAVDRDGAAQRRLRAGQRSQRGRLAGAVGAEQGDDLPRLDLEVQPAHHRDPAVAGVQVLGGEHRGHRTASASSGFALTEVGDAHGGVGADDVGSPLGDLAAELQHDDAVRHAEDEVHVVLDDEHGDPPLVGEAPHEAAELRALLAVEPGGGLVEEQHRRLRGDGAGDGDEAPASVGQLRRLAVQVGGELELTHGGDRGWWQGRRAGPDEVGHHRGRSPLVAGGPEVLEDGQVLEELQALERPRQAEAHPPVGGQRAHGAPVEEHLAGRRPHEGGHGVDERRLAGAVRPDEPDDLAGAHLQVDVVEGDGPTEANRQASELEACPARRDGRRPPPAAPRSDPVRAPGGAGAAGGGSRRPSRRGCAPGTRAERHHR